jgi:hypothetical protein
MDSNDVKIMTEMGLIKIHFNQDVELPDAFSLKTPLQSEISS